MLTTTQIHDIRKQYFEEGKNISEISKETGHDRKTIRWYIEKDDWNTPKPKVLPVAEFPKLDPFKADIDEWLTEDKKAKRKQRHTARRVYDRLLEKYGSDFDCSYRTVAGYVAKRKKNYSKTKQAIFHWSIFQVKLRLILEMPTITKMAGSIAANI